VLIIASRVDPYGPLWPVITDNPRIIYVDSSIYADVLYRAADYLVQLSSIESWCYTIREALANNVAVIGSKIPEIKKAIKDGVNGYLLDDDLGNLDVDKIFSKIPKPKGYSESVPDIWRDVMEGRL
jgi:glycosyltransferase involved in cell wall biosynthesis